MIVEYNFKEFTDKDMFEMKLKGIIPDFGYIASTKRKPFFEFCIKHRFMDHGPTYPNNKFQLYDVLIDFRFSGMLSYGPTPIIFVKGCKIWVQSSYKMHNLRENDA